MRDQIGGDGLEPDRVARLHEHGIARFDELAAFLADVPATLDVPEHLPAFADEPSTSLPFFEAYFSNFILLASFLGGEILNAYGWFGLLG